MPIRWAVASGNFSNLAIWNDSGSLGFPTASDDIWANNNNINIDQSFTAISLNNSARARDIATPQMTSNSSPSPFVIFASSTSGGTNEPWRAFDRGVTPGSLVGFATAPGQLTGSIGVDFGSGSSTVIDAYDIVGYGTTAGQSVFNAQQWALQASNDNLTWINLHIVSGSSPIAPNSTYSVGSIGNTTGYRYYRINVTLNGGTAPLYITEILLYQRGTAALAAGGSFIFNSGSISGSATSTTAALTAGATNLIQVTAATGSVTLSLGSSVQQSIDTVINHSGNCNFNLNGQNFVGGGLGLACIRKSSAGTITITGNLLAGSAQNSNPFISTNGNTVVNGNITGNATSTVCILQSVGNLTVIGNVTANNNIGISLTGASSQCIISGNRIGGSVNNAIGVNMTGGGSLLTVVGNIIAGSGGNGAHGVNFNGVSGSITGNIVGGNLGTATGVNTTSPITVTGNVTGGSATAGITTSGNVTVIGNTIAGAGASAISTPSNISINITGNTTATSTAPSISSTGTGTVLLTGNMINVSGRQAIFSQNLFISNAATSQWRLFTQGGQDKTLYSADTFPNQPTSANVRSGSLFGPANSLSGSMVVPLPSDVRVNVLTDNTVGTGQSLTAADFLAAISSSADPFAERLRNVATVDTVGSLVTGLNGGF